MHPQLPTIQLHDSVQHHKIRTCHTGMRKRNARTLRTATFQHHARTLQPHTFPTAGLVMHWAFSARGFLLAPSSPHSSTTRYCTQKTVQHHKIRTLHRATCKTTPGICNRTPFHLQTRNVLGIPCACSLLAPCMALTHDRLRFVLRCGRTVPLDCGHLVRPKASLLSQTCSASSRGRIWVRLRLAVLAPHRVRAIGLPKACVAQLQDANRRFLTYDTHCIAAYAA